MVNQQHLSSMTTQTAPSTLMKGKREKTCCGVIHEATETAREKRYNRKTPQPWIVRKLVVGVTMAIMGYTAYVYIQRLCIAMIRRERRAQADRRTGIILLVVFCVLYLWLIWAYIRVVLTPPGYAKDYVKQTERPLIPAVAPLHESWHSSNVNSDIETGNRHSQQSQGPSLTNSQTSHRLEPPGLAGPSYEDLLRRDDSRRSEARDRGTGALDAITIPKPTVIPPVPAPSTHLGSPFQSTSPSNRNPSNKARSKRLSSKRDNARKREQKLDALNITRRPPSTPVLDPVHRYCSTDQIVKPYRTHHCRICGTCVLKYDHHCPWIGQCVGARNHKFFVNFNQATVVFASYVLGTLLAYTIRSGDSPSLDIDPQEIVVMAMAGLFLLFTFLLLASHIGLILRGLTTVESLQAHNMKDRESRLLAEGFKWWQFGAKRRLQEEWDQEWGTIDREGNIWWLGDVHEEWTSVMGTWWLGWFLPVGRSGNDGVSYPVNPRFDVNGRWRRRAEWPEELR